MTVPREESQALARLDPQALLDKALERGASIEALERLVALAKDVRQQQAREAWYDAMAEFQRRCPVIRKTKTARISTRGGQGYEYSYAPLDGIVSTIKGAMGDLGLSVSWRSRIEADKVYATCRIAHALGHVEESGEIGIPVQAAGEIGANAAQRIGIATTYARRYSLLLAAGLAPEDDDDGQGLDDKDTASQDPGYREAEASAPPAEDRTISEGQVKMLSAVAAGHRWSEDQLHELLTSYRYNSRKEVKLSDFDSLVNRLKQGPPK